MWLVSQNTVFLLLILLATVPTIDDKPTYEVKFYDFGSNRISVVPHHGFIRIILTCKDCRNVTLMDTRRMDQLKIKQNDDSTFESYLSAISKYIWYFDTGQLEFNLSYRLCNPEENIKWHKGEANCSRTYSNFDVCVVSQSDDGGETTCNPLSKELCKEVHQHEKVEYKPCVNGTQYQTWCDALVDMAAFDDNRFMMYEVNPHENCSKIKIPSEDSLALSMNIINEFGKCTDDNPKFLPLGSLLHQKSHGFGEPCLKCVSSMTYRLKSGDYDPCDIDGDFSKILDKFEHPVVLKIKRSQMFLARLYFSAVKSITVLNSSGACPITSLNCSLRISDGAKYKWVTGLSYRFVVNGKNVSQSDKFTNVPVTETGQYECFVALPVYGMYWYEQPPIGYASFSVTNCETVSVGSTESEGINDYLYVVIVISSLVGAAVLIIILYFVVRYFRKKHEMNYLLGTTSSDLSTTSTIYAERTTLQPNYTAKVRKSNRPQTKTVQVRAIASADYTDTHSSSPKDRSLQKKPGSQRAYSNRDKTSEKH